MCCPSLIEEKLFQDFNTCSIPQYNVIDLMLCVTDTMLTH